MKSEEPEFLEAVAGIPEEVKKELWQGAEGEVPPDAAGRGTNIKIKYAEAVFDYLISQGHQFSKQVLSFALIKKLEV